MRKGFTLVELSIVLVIIGLLIGGLLVGQSLISSAKIQGYVRKLQQYEVANQQFMSKFKKMAGDSPSFSPAGTGNGVLDGSGACSGQLVLWEPGQVWYQLVQAGMLPAKLATGNVITGYKSTSCGASANSAESEFRPLFSEYKDSVNYPGVTKFYIDFSRGSGVTSYFDGVRASNTRLYYFYLKTIDLKALESKMDGGASSTIQPASAGTHYDPNSADNEITPVVYSPDRQLTFSEKDAFGCEWYNDCGT